MANLHTLFIANLKAARKRRNMTQANLAEEADVSIGFIGDIETGRTYPSFQTLEKLAEVLEMEPYELLLPPEHTLPLKKTRIPYILDDIKTVLEQHSHSDE